MSGGLLRGFREFLLDTRERLGVRTYAQEGEDRILARYFNSKQNGFFVDVGAHHPFRFSNTYLLYRSGWRGINIDAMPGSMRKFARFRPRDINVESAVGVASGSATYFMFNEPALNTLNADLVAEREIHPYRLIGRVQVPVRPLAEILDQHVPPGRPIDLLTVDVEGHDFEVLRSNDWERFRPRMVLAEMTGHSLADLYASAAAKFLASRGYTVAARTFNTTFMLDDRIGT